MSSEMSQPVFPSISCILYQLFTSSNTCTLVPSCNLKASVLASEGSLCTSVSEAKTIAGLSFFAFAKALYAKLMLAIAKSKLQKE